MTEAEQGSHSELGLPAKRKKPDSRDGRYTHRPAVLPPADDICRLVKLRLWYPSPSLESGLRYYFLFLGLVLLGSSLELTT